MGFSDAIKQTVLVNSARRCCVCREFKGLYIEVHHIQPQAAGGADTLDNAIALCFDCHGAAGHYNSAHPIGNKFSPAELRRHRDGHWADVAAGRFPVVPSEAIMHVHVRHLLCLSYWQARGVLQGKLRSEHFKIDYVVQTPVSRFMEAVLADYLPRIPNTPVRGGSIVPGAISKDVYWRTRAELSCALPEFANSDVRSIEERDLHAGGIRSALLADCVKAGLPTSSLGTLRVRHQLCAEEAWFAEYQVRRPVFAFTVVENHGRQAVILASASGAKEAPQGPAPRPFELVDAGADLLTSPPIKLAPGQSVAIPSAVLLSPAEEDDLTFEWADTVQRGGAELEFTAYADEDTRLGSDAYLVVGPTFRPTSAEFLIGADRQLLNLRPFDVRRVYLLGEGWLAGSCPHAVVELDNGEVLALGEILVDAWRTVGKETLSMPRAARFLHICEFEFETTTIQTIRRKGVILVRGTTVLTRGEVLSIPVEVGDEIEIVGSYESMLRRPMSSDQLRSKRSLAAGGFRKLEHALGGGRTCD